jgi:hypothetical protein
MTEEPMGRRARIAVVVTIAVGVLVLSYRAWTHRPRTLQGRGGRTTCVVKAGDQRDAVQGRCGLPCATGAVPKAECPDFSGQRAVQGMFAMCSWGCDIYGGDAVCFYGNRVVSVERSSSVLSDGRCAWPPEQRPQNR